MGCSWGLVRQVLRDLSSISGWEDPALLPGPPCLAKTSEVYSSVQNVLPLPPFIVICEIQLYKCVAALGVCTHNNG